MLLAQISDPHFLVPGTLAYGALDTAGALARAIDHVNGLRPAVDAVVVTGDITSDGDAAAYAEVARFLGEIRAPWFPLTGNHDRRELMRASLNQSGKLPADGPLCYVIDQFPVRVIVLDTLVEGQPYGELGEHQRAWLADRLAEAPDHPTVVAMHHPPFKTGVGHLDWSMLRDADPLAEIIRDHPQVERVICGHVHRPAQRRFGGTLAQICPGTVNQTELILGTGRGGWICEPPAVLLHLWDGTGLASHMSYIGDYEPSGQFSTPHIHPG